MSDNPLHCQCPGCQEFRLKGGKVPAPARSPEGLREGQKRAAAILEKLERNKPSWHPEAGPTYQLDLDEPNFLTIKEAIRLLAAPTPEGWPSEEQIARVIAEELEFEGDEGVYVVGLASAAQKVRALFSVAPAAPTSGAEWQEKVGDFANAILHGDNEHRLWLLEAAANFIEGKPVPPPRPPSPSPPGWEEAREALAGELATDLRACAQHHLRSWWQPEWTTKLLLQAADAAQREARYRHALVRARWLIGEFQRNCDVSKVNIEILNDYVQQIDAALSTDARDAPSPSGKE